MNIYRAVTSFYNSSKKGRTMKKLTVAISAVAASVLMAMSAQAAEIYNKDSNKLDLYGKVNANHTSPLMMQMMVILLMPVLASKVKPKSTIN